MLFLLISFVFRFYLGYSHFVYFLLVILFGHFVIIKLVFLRLVIRVLFWIVFLCFSFCCVVVIFISWVVFIDQVFCYVLKIIDIINSFLLCLNLVIEYYVQIRFCLWHWVRFMVLVFSVGVMCVRFVGCLVFSVVFFKCIFI